MLYFLAEKGNIGEKLYFFLLKKKIQGDVVLLIEKKISGRIPAVSQLYCRANKFSPAWAFHNENLFQFTKTKQKILSEIEEATRNELLYTVYTVSTVFSVFIAHTFQTALHGLNSGMYAYIYCYEVRALVKYGFMDF